MEENEAVVYCSSFRFYLFDNTLLDDPILHTHRFIHFRTLMGIVAYKQLL